MGFRKPFFTDIALEHLAMLLAVSSAFYHISFVFKPVVGTMLIDAKVIFNIEHVTPF